MVAAPARTIPAGGVACVSAGRCGESTGWHYQGSDAHLKCARMAETLSTSTERMRSAVAAGMVRSQADQSAPKPLRALELDERELLESMRQTALRFLPFYSHMLYKVRPAAVDEEPVLDESGKPHFQMRAGIDEDWRLLVNFGWVRHEFQSAYDQHSGFVRSRAAEQGVHLDDDAVRAGCELFANIQMAKVLLHEMGHGMYNTWQYTRDAKLDHDLMNRAEDAVINNALRVLGADKRHPATDENINGEFLKNAVYGGSIRCDDPGHSWQYRNPATGEIERRCNYDQTTQHYYKCLEKDQQQQKQQQGSKGRDENDDAPPAGKGNNTGERKGDKGGSDRERQQGGKDNSSPEGGDQSGSGGQERSPGDDLSGGGNGDDKTGSNSGHKHDDTGCGRSAAEKYADDPFEKGTVGESQKEVSLDVTASEMERWASENEQRAKNMGFGAGSMARRWANHRRRTDNIRWDAVLNRTVRRTIESLKTSRETYTKIRRRDVANMGVIRRGTRSGYMPSIATAIDTSGSMSQDDLFMAYNSVRSVIKRTGITSVDAFAVDSEAKSKPIKIKKAEDLAPLLKGGGGTDMCAGIEVAAKNGNDVCIVFTDGVVPWGKMESRPRHIKSMEVVVAVIAETADAAATLADNVPSWMKTVKISKEALAASRGGPNDGTFVG